MGRASSSGLYHLTVLLVGTGCLGFFLITWILIPFLWLAVFLMRNHTRAVLTNRRLCTKGGDASLAEIEGIEYSGHTLKVRAQGAVYRLSGLAQADEFVRDLRREVSRCRQSP